MTVVTEPDEAGSETIDTVGISLADLQERLGAAPAQELFERLDEDLRRGDVIVGTNVRAGRVAFTKARTAGHAQLVIPHQSQKRPSAAASLSEGFVIIALEDFEAVVKAGQKDFDWTAAFAPRADLPAAETSPAIRRGSRGRRALRA
jgi:hypothetical protein